MTEITEAESDGPMMAAPDSTPMDGSRGLEGSRAYEVYARLNGRTASEQIAHDRSVDPINLRRPYLAWKDALIDRFGELYPRRVHLGNHGPYVDGDTFNDWLEFEWEPAQIGLVHVSLSPDEPTRR
jgi:hypothetical protein